MSYDNGEEVFERAKAQVESAVQVYLHVLERATEIVDSKMPFASQIKLATLPSEKHERIMNRAEAISVVVSNLLTLCGELRS